MQLELKAIDDCDVGFFRSLQDPDPSWQDRQVARYISPNADLLWQETIRATQPSLECRRGGDALHSKPSLVFPKLAPCRQSLKRTAPSRSCRSPAHCFDYLERKAILMVFGELTVDSDIDPQMLADRLAKVHNLGVI